MAHGNLGIDGPRGYCPICRQFNYHAPTCPVPATVWGPRPRRRSRLRTLAILLAWLLTLIALVAAAASWIGG